MHVNPVRATELLDFIELLQRFAPQPDDLRVIGGYSGELCFGLPPTGSGWQGLDPEPLMALGWAAGPGTLEAPGLERHTDQTYKLAIAALRLQLGGPDAADV